MAPRASPVYVSDKVTVPFQLQKSVVVVVGYCSEFKIKIFVTEMTLNSLAMIDDCNLPDLMILRKCETDETGMKSWVFISK